MGRSPQAALQRAVALLAGVVVARARGTSLDGLVGTEGSAEEGEVLAALAAGAAAWPGIDAQWLGASYERAIDAVAKISSGASRRHRGVFYTPAALVGYLLDATLEPMLDRGDAGAIPSVLDPACGCGAFLVEAARRIRARRPAAPAGAVAGALAGADIDPNACVLCRLALWLELGGEVGPESVEPQIRTGDSLTDVEWGRAFDVVVGNPPFLNQLASSTARDGVQAARLRERFGSSLRSYTDPAALFLQLGVEATRVGGRVGMVLPVSVLASRDAAAVRGRVRELAAVRSLWLDTDGLFEAGVRTVAVAMERGAAGDVVERWSGSAFRGAGAARLPSGESWGALGADLGGIPRVPLVRSATLSAMCEVTAGFRDEYYAVVGALVEASGPGGQPGEDEMPVATVGMIEPFALRWGERMARIGGREWLRPCVPASAGGALGKVLGPQKRAKLLVATQSPTIEVAADGTGAVAALTPVISVFPEHPEDLWRVGAVVASPVVAAWVGAEAFGTARSLGAVKPSAALLRRVPLPVDRGAWAEAAERFRGLCESGRGATESQLVAFGVVACAAHGVSGESGMRVLGWWLERVARGRA